MRGFFAEFILSGQSEILRCAQDDSEGIGMTLSPTVGDELVTVC